MASIATAGVGRRRDRPHAARATCSCSRWRRRRRAAALSPSWRPRPAGATVTVRDLRVCARRCTRSSTSLRAQYLLGIPRRQPAGPAREWRALTRDRTASGTQGPRRAGLLGRSGHRGPRRTRVSDLTRTRTLCIRSLARETELPRLQQSPPQRPVRLAAGDEIGHDLADPTAVREPVHREPQERRREEASP